MTRSVHLVWSRWVPRVKIPLLWTMLLRKALEPEWVDGQMKPLPVRPSEIQLHPFPRHYAHQLILMTFSNYRTKHSTNIIEQWVILLKKNFNTNHHNFLFPSENAFWLTKGPSLPPSMIFPQYLTLMISKMSRSTNWRRVTRKREIFKSSSYN